MAAFVAISANVDEEWRKKFNLLNREILQSMAENGMKDAEGKTIVVADIVWPAAEVAKPRQANPKPAAKPNRLVKKSAGKGKKIDFIAKNAKVCFTVERNVRLVVDDASPCKWTFSYESAVGYGRIEELSERDDKNYGLSEVVRHYSGKGWDFESHELNSTRIWRISVDSVTGKRSG